MVTGLGAPLWDTLGQQLTRGPRLTVATAFVGSGPIPVSVQAPGTVTYTGWKAGLTRPACDATGWSSSPPTSVSRPAGTKAVEGPQTVWVLGKTSDGACYAAKAAVTVDLTGPQSTIAAAVGVRAAADPVDHLEGDRDRDLAQRCQQRPSGRQAWRGEAGRQLDDRWRLRTARHPRRRLHREVSGRDKVGQRRPGRYRDRAGLAAGTVGGDGPSDGRGRQPWGRVPAR